ncbi:MAG TPA: cupin domain-containing protein [Candidatus Dormibacteraeota bacterium]|jgi:quercetin dioxygenase-like cupin family protein|nr:cupin domain-containing protein [Candidatus Dormibacteraeota bacterium]
MPVIRSADRRLTETPNAVMTTFASPTLGGAERPVWRVDMRAGAEGPLHVFDVEQVWIVIDGAARVEIGDEIHTLAAGDTVVIPSGRLRRILADPNHGLAAIVTAAPGARASLPDGTDRGVPGWIA